MLQTAKPSRIAVPADHSEVPGWLDSTSISGRPPTSSKASSPIVVNTWRSWRWTATDRRYRYRMKPYHAAERATSSQPVTPPVGSRDAVMATAAAQAAVVRQAAASQTVERVGDARNRTSAASATYRTAQAACSRTGDGSDGIMPRRSCRASPPGLSQRAPSRNRMTRMVANRINRSSSSLRFFT